MKHVDRIKCEHKRKEMTHNLDEIKIPVLGRTGFGLGNLYDVRSEKVSSYNLWKTDSIERGKKVRNASFTNCDVHETNSLEEKTNLLKLKGKLSIDICFNQIEFGGSGNFFQDHKESGQSDSVTLFYKKHTREEWLPNEMFSSIDCFDFKDNLEKIDYTHVIVSVVYGGEAFFTFEKEYSNESSKLDAGASLKADISKTFTLKAEGSGEFNDSNSSYYNDMKCKYHCNLKLNEIPRTFQEAVVIYKTLPALIDDNTSVPVQVNLMPLKKLGSRMDRIIITVENELLRKCRDEFDNINHVKISIKTFLKSKICDVFPDFRRKCSAFQKLLEQHELKFQSKAKELITKICFGEKMAEKELVQLLENISMSVFCFERLNEWISTKTQEVAKLEQMVDMIKKNNKAVRVCSNITDVTQQSKAISVDFTVYVDSEDKYLKQMRKFLQESSTKENISVESTLLEEIGNGFKLLNRYRSFALANNQNKEISFIIRPLFKNEIPEYLCVFNIIVTNNGATELWNNIIEPPSNFYVSNVTHNSCQLSWQKPSNNESISLEYIVSLFEFPGQSNKRDPVLRVEKKLPINQTEISFENLEIFKEYKVQICILSKYGRSEEMVNSFKTLRCEPVTDIRAVEIHSNFIEIEWQHPITSKVEPQSYFIEVFECGETKFTEKKLIKSFDSEKRNIKVEKLNPLTEYIVAISVVADIDKSIPKEQFFRTTSGDGFPSEILISLWNVLKAKEFASAVTANDMIKQTDNLLNLKLVAKQKMGAHLELWVHQLLISTEFNLFTTKLVDLFNNTDKDTYEENYTEISVRQKLKELVCPFFEDHHSNATAENKRFFTWLFPRKNDYFASKEFEKIQDLKIFLTQRTSSAEFKTSLQKFLEKLHFNYNKAEEYIIIKVAEKFGSNRIDTDINIKGMVSKLSLFDESVIKKYNKVLDVEKHEISCIQFALQTFDNKRATFKELRDLLTCSNPSSMNLVYMNEFLDKWDPLKLEKFIEILKTSRDFSEIYEVDIPKAIFEILANLTSKLKENKIDTDFEEITLPGHGLSSDIIERFKITFEKLNCSDYWTKSLSRQDTYGIKMMEEATRAPEMFLNKILALNYQCRDNETAISRNKTEEANVEEDFFFDFNDKEEIFNSNNECEISNADTVLTSVIACNPLLLQDVFEKMAMCHLAIPIVFPNPKLNRNVFNLWSLRAIKARWTLQCNKSSKEAHLTSVYCKTISFCRFGDLDVSKSKTINSFLSTAQKNPEHSFFLHRDNDIKSLLNDGVIEACWYTPQGRDDETLKDLTCIYNLRGNAENHKDKFDFLIDVSATVVVFIAGKPSNEQISRFKSSKTPLILVLPDLEGTMRKSETMRMIFGKNKTVVNLAKDICNALDMESNHNGQLTLEDHAIKAANIGILIDEDQRPIQEGKKHASNIIDIFRTFSMETIKENVVPLQGDSWKNWAHADKEQFRQKLRSNNEDSPKYVNKMHQKKRRYREEQRNIGISDAMYYFLNSLLSLHSSSINYYIDYVQFYLNKSSERFLPKFLKKYNLLINDLGAKKKELEECYQAKELDLSQKKSLETEIKSLTNKVKEIAEQFDTASFGIEHIFREMAQLYEGFECIENTPTIIDYLPKMMAKLIIKGYPLEIMDGNVSQVPMKWLEKVFFYLDKELKKQLQKEEDLKEERNPRIFVSSILGIQSSGKSTLLNTMYGSKFSVSSGRCTRGVFIQLLPVAKSWRKRLKCDYYLLMDSEGLRSPEMGDSYNHDNEIATLISCLANTTIINFWGQTFSKDMGDVILIAAYAYIRMTEVKIRSSFHLVFTCVQDPTAAEKNQFGLTKVMDEINKSVQDVAEAEGRSDLLRGLESIFPMIKDFYDGISFPQFFPVLWHGSMSPPDPRYGQLVNKLKYALMEALRDENGTKHVQPINEFLNRLRDVWMAIKMEDFVFGFRNTQALQDYNNLQLFYDQQLQIIRRFFYDGARKLESDIMSEISSQKRIPLETIMQLYNEKFDTNHLPAIEEQKETIKENLRKEVGKLSNPENGVMHLSTFENHLTKTIENLTENEKSRILRDVRLILKKDISTEEKPQELKKEFLMKARELAVDVRNHYGHGVELSKDLIDTKFNDLFTEFIEKAKIEDLETFGNPDDIPSLVIKDCFPDFAEYSKKLKLSSHKFCNQEKTKAKFPQPQDPIIVTKEDIRKHGLANLKFWENDTALKVASSELLLIKKHVNEILSDISTSKNFSYLKTVTDILSHVYERTEKNHKEENWSFNPEFRMRVLAYYFRLAVKEVAEIQMKIFKRYSLVNTLMEHKLKLKTEFEQDCNAANIDVRTIDTYYKDVLYASIIKRIKNDVGLFLYEDLERCDIFADTNKMMFEVLKELLNKKSAREVQAFSDDFKRYISDWIESKVVNKCMEKNHLRNTVEKEICFIKRKMVDIFKETADKANNEGMEVTTWFTALQTQLLKHHPAVDLNAQKAMMQIKDINFATSQLMAKLGSIKEQQIYDEIVISNHATMNEEKKVKTLLNWFQNQPLKQLCEKKIGCTAQCLFCGTKCHSGIQCDIKTIKRHQAGAQHRQRGWTGRVWEDSGKLITDICNHAVDSNAAFKLYGKDKERYKITHDNYIPYKDAHKIVTDWSITPLRDAESSFFWQYLFKEHNNELAKIYGAQPADLPPQYKDITEKDALDCLKREFGQL